MDSVTKANVSFRFDDVVVDGDRFRVEKDGQPRKITPRAFDVLVYLVEHRDRIVEKQELFEQIWKESFVTDNALTRTIKEIRQVIGDDADAPRYIETTPKRGYRFIAEIKEAEQTEAVTSKTEVAAVDQVISQAEPLSEAATETTTHAEPGAARAALSLTGVRQLVTAVALVLVAVITIALWRSQTRPTPTPTIRAAKATQIPTWTGLEIPKLSPDGNSIAYSSDHDGAAEIYVKPLTPGAREIKVTSDGQRNFEPAWSPDGKLIAFRSQKRGGIWIIAATGGTARKLSDFGSSPAWSRDGSFIAFQSESTGMPPTTIWTISSQGGEPTPITQVGNPGGGHSVPTWSPDGKRIAFVAYSGGSGELWTVGPNGEELKLVAREFSNPVYSPDGEYIYGGSGTQFGGNFALNRLRISPSTGAAHGEPEVVRDTGLARIEGPLTISSDGKRIAYSAQTLTASLMSLQISSDSGDVTSSPLPLDPSTSFRKSKAIFSSDGRKIAFVEFRGGEQPRTCAMDADGRNVTQLTTGRDADFVTGWLPDNDTVVFQRNNKIWSVSVSAGRQKLLLDLNQDIGWPRVSPDGKQIAFNSTKGETINIWTVPVEGGTPLQLTFDTEQTGWPCWSPDGKLFALQMKRGANGNIGLMPSSGGEITQLTFEPGLSWSNDFSPDGDKIAFAGQRDGIWNVYWISRSTKQQKQLTHYTSRNHYVRYPSWSPLGNQIVYEYAVTTGNIWLLELK